SVRPTSRRGGILPTRIDDCRRSPASSNEDRRTRSASADGPCDGEPLDARTGTSRETRTAIRTPWRLRSALPLISFVFQRPALVAEARRCCGDVGVGAVNGTVRGRVARLMSDRLGFALGSRFGFAGGLEALLAWHGWGASNICAQERECIRSIAYAIRPQ